MYDPRIHHDALEFPDGQLVMITRLVPVRRTAVLQLSARTAAPTRRVIRRHGEVITTPTLDDWRFHCLSPVSTSIPDRGEHRQSCRACRGK